jgi:hypothetical protein
VETINQMFEEKASPVSTSPDETIREFIRLDTQIKELAYERAGYTSALTQSATDIRNGQNTVHLETADRMKRVKVEFKKGFLCDAVELECAKDLLGDERFNELFKTEYTPKAKNLKTFLNTKSADERTEAARQILKEAVKEIEKTPYVSVERK